MLLFISLLFFAAPAHLTAASNKDAAKKPACCKVKLSSASYFVTFSPVSWQSLTRQYKTNTYTSRLIFGIANPFSWYVLFLCTHARSLTSAQTSTPSSPRSRQRRPTPKIVSRTSAFCGLRGGWGQRSVPIDRIVTTELPLYLHVDSQQQPYKNI